MAKKHDGRFVIHKKPGIGLGIALDLSKAEAIEEMDPGRYAVYIAGRQHIINSEESLSDLTGAEAPAAADQE